MNATSRTYRIVAGRKILRDGRDFVTINRVMNGNEEPPEPTDVDAFARLCAASPALLAALESTARFLEYEATCHEESGDPKRRTYVASIRSQVASARAALAVARGA